MTELQGKHRPSITYAEILQDLAKVGFTVQEISELRDSGMNYRKAVPTLLKWLVVVDNPRIKEAIVRALSIPWAKPTATQTLLKEFWIAKDHALKWALGNALEVLAHDSVVEEFLKIVINRDHGTPRQMVVVGLGKMHDPRVIPTLQQLLMDDEVSGHAIIALGRLKSRESLSLIEPFLKHKKSWIRKEAVKAIDKIQKKSSE